MRICYFAHDISHADISRRYDMFVLGGAETVVAGFRRLERPDPGLTGQVIDFGRTVDARFDQRALAVARTLPRLGRWADVIGASDVIIARNLEMLALAASARRRFAPSAALVYECLDIHRLMVGGGAVGAGLRVVERSLLAQCQGLIVSSPGFVREYFQKQSPRLPKVFLVENKVYATTEPARTPATDRPGPPWRIGWYGAIRCRRSLEILIEAVKAAPGLLEVTIAGRAVTDVFPDLAVEVREVPGITFHGSFKDEAELERLFRSTHFSWALDFYEAGRNSDWLLPNRLYRAALYGSVPIAQADVETGRWLAERHAGLLLQQPTPAALVEALRAMTPERLAVARAELERIPTTDLVSGPQDCVSFVEDLRELKGSAASERGGNGRVRRAA